MPTLMKVSCSKMRKLRNAQSLMLLLKEKIKLLSAYMVYSLINVDRIITNNNNDPLYPQQAKNNSAHHSSLNSARNSRSQMKSHKNSQANNKSHQASTITKFVGELAKSLAKDD